MGITSHRVICSRSWLVRSGRAGVPDQPPIRVKGRDMEDRVDDDDWVTTDGPVVMVNELTVYRAEERNAAGDVRNLGARMVEITGVATVNDPRSSEPDFPVSIRVVLPADLWEKFKGVAITEGIRALPFGPDLRGFTADGNAQSV